MEKQNKPVKQEPQEVIYYQEDEIDLYELWLTLKKRWKVVAATTVIFLLAGVGYILISKPVYETKFIVKLPIEINLSQEKTIYTPILSVEETQSIIDNINYLVKNQKFKKLSEILNLREEKIRSIKSISVKKNRNNKEVVIISLEVYNPLIIPALATSILSYLNKNSLLQERLSLKKKETLSQIKLYKEKLKEINQIKKQILNQLNSGNIKVIGFNPLDLEKDIIKIHSQLKKLEIYLQSIKGFDMSVKPIIPEKPQKPKKALIIAVSSVSGLFLGIFLAFFLEWIENARKRHEKT